MSFAHSALFATLRVQTVSHLWCCCGFPMWQRLKPCKISKICEPCSHCVSPLPGNVAAPSGLDRVAFSAVYQCQRLSLLYLARVRSNKKMESLTLYKSGLCIILSGINSQFGSRVHSVESISTFCMDGLLRLSEVFGGCAEMCLNAAY